MDYNNYILETPRLFFSDNMKKERIYTPGFGIYTQLRILMILFIAFICVGLTFIAIIIPNFFNLTFKEAIIGFLLSLILTIGLIALINYQQKKYKFIKEEREKLDKERINILVIKLQKH